MHSSPVSSRGQPAQVAPASAHLPLLGRAHARRLRDTYRSAGMGDLKSSDKRDAYLDVGGQCWYVLGCDRKGRPIAQADEVPPECGVLHAVPDGQLEVLRHAPQRAVSDLPFALWMALAKATPLPPVAWSPGADPEQALLVEQDVP